MKHLQEHGPLTQRMSYELYNDTRLAAHVEALRRQGHKIDTSMVREGRAEFAQYHYRKD